MRSENKNETPVLRIKDLSVVYKTEGNDSSVLRNISLEVRKSQIYGLVGESGSGKTTLGLSILRYLPRGGQVMGGSLEFASRNLLDLTNVELRELWGKDLSLVPQDPYSSLNPSLQIGKQISENFRDLPQQEAKDLALSWLEKVQLPDPELLINKYPHELSGGQKQRILIALALSNNPRLLVLDEPTTSLDVTTEGAILDLLKNLIREKGISVLYISHNLGLVAGISDRVAILYAGELVEDGITDTIYRKPIHPYTQGLLASVPQLGSHKDLDRLTGIPGQIPDSQDLPQGCVFAPRCPLKIDLCTQMRPALEQIDPDHNIRCHRWQEIKNGEISYEVETTIVLAESPHEPAPVLKVEDLEVNYRIRRQKEISWLGIREKFNAVDGVNIQVQRQRTLGIVGESGSGKSSLALAVMGLVDREKGKIKLLNIPLPSKLEQRDKDLLTKLQMVFQNLDEAFSPYLSVEEILKRPLLNLIGMTNKKAKSRVNELLNLVQIPPGYSSRFSGQLSGGEKQRIAIAQAIAANPDLLIADEPVSALDVSVQANILNLLNGLQRQQKTANILISHDIAVVSYLADEVAVMYLGQIMQFSPRKNLFQPPFHPYTEALFSAISRISPKAQNKRIQLVGDVASPDDKPTGCPFHTRCPRYLGDICKIETPAWQKTRDGKDIFCHIPLEELAQDQEPVVDLQSRMEK